jgi:hypothetical protein
VEAQSDTYSKQWKNIDSIILKSGLNKTALNEINAVYKKAVAEKNEAQKIKALLYRIQVMEDLDEESSVTAIKSLEKEIKTNSGAAKAILQSLTAQAYWQYLQENQYELRGRTTIAGSTDPDIENWSIDDLHKRIIALYNESLSSKSLLQKTGLKAFEPLLQKGNSRKLRPTLFDLLAFRALDYFRNDSRLITKPAESFELRDVQLFAPAVAFAKYDVASVDSVAPAYQAVKIYQQIIAFHLNDKDASALIDADLNRIIYVHDNAVMENKDSLYLTALQHIISSYAGNAGTQQASYLLAQNYTERAAQYDPKADTTNRYAYTKAIEILQSILIDTTASEGRSNAQNLLNNITKPSISLQSESINSPGLPFRLLLTFRNLVSVYGRIIRLDNKVEGDRWNQEYWEKISKLPALKTIEQKLPDLNDYQQHAAEIKIDALEPGNYGLLVSTENNFEPGKQEQLSLLNFTVSGLAYFNKDNIHFVANRETGTPIQNAIIEEAVNIYNQKSRTYEFKVTNTYKSDNTGSFETPRPAKDDYSQKRFIIKYNNDELIVGKESNYYTYEENQNDPKELKEFEEKYLTSYLFSDRSVYRPGQTVFFKGIMTTKDFNSKKNKVVAGKNVWIFLYDANDEEVDSLFVTTNEFGSYNGKFQLPSNLMNGNFRIEDDETSGSVDFSVEEYKRPKFKTDLVKPVETFKVNDSISVKGITTAFAGNSISNAKVNYRVRRMARYPIWRSYYSKSIFPRQESQEITHGTTTTDAGGNFLIEFKAIPDLKIDPKTDPIFSYTVSVDVTDINGETHGTSQTIDAGYKSFQLDLDLKEEITTNELPTLKINTSNLNEQPVTTSVKIELNKLESPANNFRERYWQEPDVFVLNESEYKKYFPVDIYKDENDPMTWKTVKNINLLTDSVKGSKIMIISDRNLEAGYYLINIEARNANGEMLSAKRILKVSGKEQPKGMANVQIMTSADTLIAGNKFSYGIVSNLPSVVVRTQEIENNELKPIEQKIVNGMVTREIPASEKTKRFRVDIATVYKNRFYSDSKIVEVIEEDKQLKIDVLTYRDKTMPGSPEKWTLKVSRKNNEPVELASVMYDQSLDMIRPHTWSIPSLFETGGVYHPPFKNGNNFNSVGSNNRSFKDAVYSVFEKSYDEIKYDPLVNARDMIYGSRAFENQSIKIRGVASAQKKDLSNEEVLQGKAAGIAVQDAKMEEVVVIGYSATKKTETPTITPRKDMRETAFFFPDLKTKEDGSIELNFTMPEALTSWKWLSLAHDKNLAFGRLEKIIQTQKPLMVQPNIPRFVREGDRINLSAKIVNMSEKELTGQVELQLIDPETNQPVDGWFRNFFPNQYFTAAAGESVVSDFSIEVPYLYTRPVITRFYVRSDSLTDGEETMIPVLTNKKLVTESLPLYMNGDETKTVEFKSLKNSDSSETLSHHKLTVEYTADPSWYVLQALPYMSQVTHGCADEYFTRIYANAVTNFLVNQNPQLKTRFAQLKTDTGFISKLQQNEELKNIVLQQTPWVLEAKNETEQMKMIASLFADSIRGQQENIEQLKSFQNADGGFSWFKGGRSDRYITQKILIGIGRLIEMNIIDQEEFEELVENGLEYTHEQLLKDYNNYKKSKSKTASIDYAQVQYLFMLGYFKNEPLDGKMLAAINHYRKQMTTKWTLFNKYGQAMSALSLHASGDTYNAKKILKSMQETAIHHPEMGMYWKDLVAGYYWFQSSIQSQALMIELFTKLKAPEKEINGLKTWLLKNKQSNNWGNNVATADATHAFLLNNKTLKGPAPVATISVGNQSFSNAGNTAIATGTAKNDAGKLTNQNLTDTAFYFKKSIAGEQVNPAMANIKIETKGTQGQASWGSVYWQYFENLDKIKAAGNAIKISKELFITRNTDKGPVLERFTEGNFIKVGDKITVRIQIQSDRNMEYVHVRDMRAASFETINPISGYNWKGGLGFYQSAKDASMDFYIDYLRKGEYVFEYQLNATLSGTFTNGITTAQCMYAPEFMSHTGSSVIMVEKE